MMLYQGMMEPVHTSRALLEPPDGKNVSNDKECMR